MKRICLVLFIVLLIFSCKKAEKAYDFRENVVGTYKGTCYQDHGTPLDSSTYQVTISVVAPGEAPSHNISIYGDIVSNPNYNPGHSSNNIYLNDDYTFSGGKFINDSLIYTAHVSHYGSTYCHYFLKKQ